jgi:hypothetical protein
MPTPKFEFLARQVNGRFALLIWRGYSSREGAIDGADTFVIENGLIRLQTIHYRLVSPSQRLKMMRRPGDRASFQSKDQANCSCRPPRHVEASGSLG